MITAIILINVQLDLREQQRLKLSVENQIVRMGTGSGTESLGCITVSNLNT